MSSKKGEAELKKRIQELENENHVLKSIFDSSHEWEMLLDKKRQLLHISPSFEKITGYKIKHLREDLNFLHSIVHPKDKDILTKFEKKISGKNFKTAISSIRIITKDNKVKWISFHCCILYDKKKKCIGFRYTNKDITEHKNTEQVLRDSEKKYKLLSEISTDEGTLFTMQKDGTFLREWSINKLTNQYGYGLNEVDSFEKWLKKVHPDDREEFLKKIAQLKKGVPVSSQIRLITNHGETRWIHSTASPFNDPEKNTNYILSFAKDITEFKKAEQDLIESEKRYRMLSQISTDDGSSLIVQEDGSFLREWSIDTLSNKYGYKKTEIDTFDKWLPYIHPEDKKKFIEGVSQLKKGLEVSVQLRVLTKSGEIKWIQNTVKPSLDPESKRLRLLSAIKDITDYKNKELSLQDNEDKFKAIFNTIDVGIIQSIGTGGFDVVNDSLIEMLGYSREELSTLKTYDITLTEDLRKEFDVFNKAVKHKEPSFVIEKRFVRKDASIMLCRATYHILYDEFKTVKQVLAVIHDITEQRKAETALLESEHKYRNLAENTEDLIAKCDADFKILFVNKAVEKFNFKVDQFVGKKLSELDLPLELLFNLEEYLQMVIKGKKPVQTTVHYNLLGRDIYFSCRFYPEFNIQGIVSYIHCVCSDITELIKIEQELIKAKDKAEESDRLKSIFLANMSHEIRTPMNAIVGFATLLENEELTTENKKKYIEIINHSAENLLTIINDILDISKIEAGQLETCKAAFNLHHLLQESYEQIKLQKKSKNKEDIKIILKNDCSCEFELYSDEVRIQQILTNLLNNALKFIQQGHIEFGYERVTIDNKAFLQFHVRDSGIGIAEDKKKIIFERFRQEEESIHTTHDGTGLGLAICKGILDIMGGSIWVETMKGEGTIFYFTIPITDATPKIEKEVIAPMTSDFIFINKTILIVDDTPEIHQYFTEVLSKTGAHILHALNAKETLQFIDSKSPIDIILMDIRLPDINGLELTKMIKNKIKIPIIAQTAFALSSDRQQMLNAGCDDYITKPIDRLQLLMCLSKFLYNTGGAWNKN